jgi:hypothetical protein
MMLACHAGDPGSIPGGCSFDLPFWWSVVRATLVEGKSARPTPLKPDASWTMRLSPLYGKQQPIFGVRLSLSRTIMRRTCASR